MTWRGDEKMWVSHKWDYGLASPSEWWPSGRWSSCPVHSRVWPLVRWSCRTWLTRVCRLASPQTYALQKHPSSMSSEQWGSALCLLSAIYCNEMRNQFFWCQNIWLKKWRQNRWVQSVRVSCEAMYRLRAQCLHRWQQHRKLLVSDVMLTKRSQTESSARLWS